MGDSVLTHVGGNIATIYGGKISLLLEYSIGSNDVAVSPTPRRSRLHFCRRFNGMLATHFFALRPGFCQCLQQAVIINPRFTCLSGRLRIFFFPKLDEAEWVAKPAGTYRAAVMEHRAVAAGSAADTMDRNLEILERNARIAADQV